jgi:LysM repeat protein
MLAYLVGSRAEIDGRETIFINGAIQGKYSRYSEGMEQFTDKSAQYAEEMLNLYFPGGEILGWMQSQPGYGAAVNPAYADCHMSRFTKPYQVLFVMDPIERLNAFYAWDDGMAAVNERRGYIIYYNKNDGMREYMLDNKLSPSRSSARAARDEPGPAASAPKARERARKEAPGEYRKIVNMLVSLSAVLFVICFIMGAGLIQSDGRISKLENEIAALDATYSFLVAQSKGGSEAVFASGSPALDEAETGGASAVLEPETHPESPLAGLPEINDGYAAESAPEHAAAPEAALSPPPAPASTPKPPPQPTLRPSPSPDPALTSGGENPNAVTSSLAEYEEYVIEQGDSLLSISWEFYGTPDRVREIMTLNGIEAADKIYYGQKLKLPPK